MIWTQMVTHKDLEPLSATPSRISAFSPPLRLPYHVTGFSFPYYPMQDKTGVEWLNQGQRALRFQAGAPLHTFSSNDDLHFYLVKDINVESDS